MEEHPSEACAGAEQLTVMGKRLQPGEAAPDFRLHYLDMVDMVVHTVGLSDIAGQVRLLSVVNSLERSVCQEVTQRWETLREALPPDACIYTISMDPLEVQADFQDRDRGAAPDIISAAQCTVWPGLRCVDQGVAGPAEAVVVIDGSDRIVYVEYVADQLSEPNYSAAMRAVQQAAKQ